MEKIYTNEDFSTALNYAKEGYLFYRDAWGSDNNVFVVMQKGYPNGISCNLQTALTWNLEEGELFRVEPYLQIQKNGTHYMWTPSTEDLFANDYTIIKL